MRGTPFTSFCLELLIIDFFLPTSTGLALNVGAQLLYIADTENGRVRVLDLNSGTIRRGSQAAMRWSNQEVHQRLKWVSWCLGFSMFFYSICLFLLVVHWLNFGGNHPGFGYVSRRKTLLLPKWCRPIISVEFWSWCLLLKGCWKIMIVWLSCFSLSLIFVDLQLSYCSGLWQGVPPQTRQPWWDSLALLRDSEAKRDMYVMVMMMVMIIIFGWFCYIYI